jgi:Glycosyl transferases group 1
MQRPGGVTTAAPGSPGCLSPPVGARRPYSRPGELMWRAPVDPGVDAARFTPHRRCARCGPPSPERRGGRLRGTPRPRSTCTGFARSPACPGFGWSSSARDQASNGCASCCPKLCSSANATATSSPAPTPRWTSSSNLPAETFCQAVPEALASGVPVVAPDTGGHRDLVLPHRTGYLVGDDTALRAAVQHLLVPRCAHGSAATARRSVLRRTWSTVGDELIAHYAAVITDADQCAAC